MKQRNIFAGADNMVLVKQDPVNAIRVTDLGDDSNGERLFKRESDIYLLFHQEKLMERMGVESIRTWLDKLNAQSSSIDYREGRFTDEQLLKFVKSRTIQEPSDLLKWSELLNDSASNLRQAFDRYVESLQQPVEPSKTE